MGSAVARRGYRAELLFGALVLLVSAMVLWRAAQRTAFAGDEAWWITVGYYYTRLLFQPWSVAAWDCWDYCSTFGSLNPHLGKWLIGIPLALTHGLHDASVEYRYCFSCAPADRLAQVPPLDLLRLARRVPTAFSALNVTLVYALVRGVSQRWFAAAWALSLLGLTAFVRTGTRAMTDPFYITFLLASCLVLMAFAHGRLRATPAALLAGACVGLAGSVKISGLAIGGLSLLLALVLLSRVQRLPLRELVRMNVLAGLSAWLLTLALNPFLWPWLGGGFDPARLSELPWLFQRWATHLDQLQFLYGGWGPSRVATFHRELLLEHGLWPVHGALALVGIAHACSVLARRRGDAGETSLGHHGDGGDSGTRHHQAALMVLLAYALTHYVSVASLIAVNWERFYLSTLLGLHLMAACGAWMLIGRARGWLSARPG